MIRTGPPHSDTVDIRPGSDLCTCCCATSKDVSQQVVVWAQTRDRAAAMLAHVVGLGVAEHVAEGDEQARVLSVDHMGCENDGVLVGIGNGRRGGRNGSRRGAGADELVAASISRVSC